MSDDANFRRGDADVDRSADLALSTTPDENFSDDNSPDDNSPDDNVPAESSAAESSTAERPSRSAESLTPARPTLTSGESGEAAR